MTGPHDSVIGSDEHNAIKRFVTGMPMRLEPATGDVRIEGVVVECDTNGRATSCTAIRIEVE
jgi:calcineurin-like phosphoesterase